MSDRARISLTAFLPSEVDPTGLAPRGPERSVAVPVTDVVRGARTIFGEDGVFSASSSGAWAPSQADRQIAEAIERGRREAQNSDSADDNAEKRREEEKRQREEEDRKREEEKRQREEEKRRKEEEKRKKKDSKKGYADPRDNGARPSSFPFGPTQPGALGVGYGGRSSQPGARSAVSDASQGARGVGYGGRRPSAQNNAPAAVTGALGVGYGGRQPSGVPVEVQQKIQQPVTTRGTNYPVEAPRVKIVPMLLLLGLLGGIAYYALREPKRETVKLSVL